MSVFEAVASKRLYRVRFVNEGKVFELYARQVSPGSLLGFVEIADLVWGRRSEVIVDPGEQDLKNEFAGVKRIHVPIHAVVRIDEVEKSGGAKILAMPTETRTPGSGLPFLTPGSGPGRAK